MTDFIQVIRPKTSEVPLLINFPHSGTSFPHDLTPPFKEKFLKCPEDADWHLQQVYSFASELGITLTLAPYSRYVVDLNRDPSGHKLYNDKRHQTSIVPTKSFAGEDLYFDEKPSEAIIQKRLEQYFTPYHQCLHTELERLKEKFGKVLLFDAHSIKHHVPLIREDPFPDFILANADGASTSKETFSLMTKIFGHHLPKNHSLKFNDPFKGGYITRSLGKPSNHIEAIQLEMCQNIYMNEDTYELDASKAKSLTDFLKNVFQDFINDYENS